MWPGTSRSSLRRLLPAARRNLRSAQVPDAAWDADRSSASRPGASRQAASKTRDHRGGQQAGAEDQVAELGVRVEVDRACCRPGPGPRTPARSWSAPSWSAPAAPGSAGGSAGCRRCPSPTPVSRSQVRPNSTSAAPEKPSSEAQRVGDEVAAGEQRRQDQDAGEGQGPLAGQPAADQR